jgi:hypothetical protein
MRTILLYIGAVLNICIALNAWLTHRENLFWWSLGCGLLLALGGVLAEDGPGSGREEP